MILPSPTTFIKRTKISPIFLSIITLDPEARKEIIWEMQHLVFDDMVFLVPFYPNAVQAYRTDRFTGWLTDANRIALEDISSLLAIEPVK